MHICKSEEFITVFYFRRKLYNLHIFIGSIAWISDQFVGNMFAFGNVQSSYSIEHGDRLFGENNDSLIRPTFVYLTIFFDKVLFVTLIC